MVPREIIKELRALAQRCWQDLHERIALDYAHAGDLKPLADALRDRGDPCSRYAADLIEGKVKRSRGCPPFTRAKAQRYEEISDFVGQLEATSPAMQRKTAVSLAAEHFACSTRTVETALAWDEAFYADIAPYADTRP